VGSLAGPGAIAGGVWQVQRTQSAALLDAGHEVRALAGWFGPLPRRVAEPFQLDLTRVRQPLPGIGLRALWSIHLNDALRNLSRWADVAHVHLCRICSQFLPSGYSTMRVCRSWRKPTGC
jgi:hypothetical protein